MEETEDGVEELHEYVFKNSSPEEQKQAIENAISVNRLVAFCVDNWANNFIRELQDELHGQRAFLEGSRLSTRPFPGRPIRATSNRAKGRVSGICRHQRLLLV